MADFSVTVQNFATLPAGVAIVWAAMIFLNEAFPHMTTRAKVIMQVVCSAVYATLATALYLNGSVRELAQQGVVLFISVAFAQTWGYETTMKLAGLKGDGKKLAFLAQDEEPVSGGTVPGSTDITIVNPEIPKDPVGPAVAAFSDYGDQGTPNGRI